MDHTGHGQVHGVARVEHLPLGTDARVHQDVVSAGQLQEQDIEQKGGAADLFRHRTGTEYQARDQIPDRHMCRNIDLLRGVPQAPPDDPVHLGVYMGDVTYRPEEGGYQDNRAARNGENRDDGGCYGAEGDQGDRTFVGLLLLGDDQGTEEYEATDERPHGEQDQPQIKMGSGLHRHIGGHHDAGVTLKDGHVGHYRTDQHQDELNPCPGGCRQPAAQQYR